MTMTNAGRIREFHATMEPALPTSPITPPLPILEVRKTLIDEEYAEVTAVFQELITASEGDEEIDITHLIHELTDLLYVTYGAIQSCGVDPDAVFAEVHAANMRKVGGPRRADGKILKPADWYPADVRGVLERLRGGDEERGSRGDL